MCDDSFNILATYASNEEFLLSMRRVCDDQNDRSWSSRPSTAI
jgi:hypothetical protein